MKITHLYAELWGINFKACIYTNSQRFYYYYYYIIFFIRNIYKEIIFFISKDS